MFNLKPQPSRLAVICASLSFFVLQAGPAVAATDVAAPAATTEVGVGQTMGEVQYLASAPTGEVDAFGFLVGRATFNSHDNSGVSLLLVQGNASGSVGDWSAHSSVRLMADSFGSSWGGAKLLFQELYGSWRRGDWGEVKLGKVYQIFGREWDYGFSGPLVSNNDLKLRPDLGVSVAGTPSLSKRVDLKYAAQYFLADGQSYGSLTGDSWGKDVRHFHTLVVNIAPGMDFGNGVEGRLGLSAKRGYSKLTEKQEGTEGLVHTLALDIDARFRDLGAFIEVGRQFEDSTNLTDAGVNFDTQVVNPAFTYVWAAAKYSYGPAKVRLSYNDTFYADAHREIQVTPGVSYQFNKNLELLAEFNLWLTNNTEATSNTYHSRFRDRALYLVLSANI